ncbi:MAG TPA: HDOD domain-containing protein [Oligoflexia bacterium]|nr:HDOD domain-containing protein [Oligoflexia bacterium]HMP49230.1 HDOD domain-containing protein [Oligoflexia bacterium]
MSVATAIPEEYKEHISPDKDWKEIVAWVSDLPPLPHVAAQALQLIEDPDTTAGKLTNLLGQDAALTARVLKIANSAMFSRQREISTINQAIMTIGFKTLKGIIVAATLRQLNRKFGPIEKMIWENSTCTAVACRILGTHMKKSYVEEIFLFGLLHDLGKLVLMRQIPKEYEQIMEQAKKGEKFHIAEQKSFGFAHPLIGALVAKKWNFSTDTCQAILHHHDDIPAKVENELQEKTLLVLLADLLSHSLGIGHPEGYSDQSDEILNLGKLLGLDEKDLENLKTKTSEMFNDIGAAFM